MSPTLLTDRPWLHVKDLTLQTTQILVFKNNLWRQFAAVVKEFEDRIELLFIKDRFKTDILTKQTLAYLIVRSPDSRVEDMRGCVITSKDIFLRSIPISRFSQIYCNQQVIQNVRAVEPKFSSPHQLPTYSVLQGGVEHSLQSPPAGTSRVYRTRGGISHAFNDFKGRANLRNPGGYTTPLWGRSESGLFDQRSETGTVPGTPRLSAVLPFESTFGVDGGDLPRIDGRNPGGATEVSLAYDYFSTALSCASYSQAEAGQISHDLQPQRPYEEGPVPD